MWLFATAVLGALGLHYAGTSGSCVDARVQHVLSQSPLADERGLLLLLGRFADPWSIGAGGIGVALVAAVLRRPRAVLLALTAPVFSGALAEWVLKPLVGRTKGLDLAFPSGTTAGAFGLAVTVCVLLAAPAGARHLARGWRVLIALGALGVASSIGVALVLLEWHYATDVIGGAATGISATLATAAAIDLLATALSVSHRNACTLTGRASRTAGEGSCP